MIILAIESSCDETAAAVVEDGTRILSNVVSSQVALHGPYGGVVPELASRKHVEMILPVISQALEEASVTLDHVDALAVTQGPGLVGALLVGMSAGKAIAYALRKPLIAVNHLEGHMHGAFLAGKPLEEPFVCLVVSGGHTALYRVEPDGTSHMLGSTRDDAAGEAFDKVAKLLQLGYPGGVEIDRLSRWGNPHAIHFPRPLMEKDSLEFSFSGLKTAVVNFVRGENMARRGKSSEPTLSMEDLVASFQEAVVDVLVTKAFRAIEKMGLRHLAVVGGVAANGRLREKLQEEAAARDVSLHVPPLHLCTDNAGMIGAAAYSIWKRSGFCLNPLDLDAKSRWL